MGDRSYIGVPAPGGGVNARYLHHGDAPGRLIPTLRAIWTGFGGDGHRMTAALLAEDWSHLTADPAPTSPYTMVAGVGCPSPGGTRPRPAHIRLTANIGAAIGWLYVIDPETAVVTVYEATVHDRWLRHSEHNLQPSHDDTAPGQPAPNPPERRRRPSMIDAHTVMTIAAGLADLLDEADDLAAPQLHLIFLPDSPQREDDRIFLTPGDRFWEQHCAGHESPEPGDVERCVELLHATAGFWMPQLSLLAGATLVGCGLMYDDPAATNATGSTGRVMIARDTDGRLYHGAVPADRNTRPHIAFGKLPDPYAVAVADALAAVMDHRVAGVYRLPSNGYILLHQTRRDGEKPQTITRFIDTANAMDDTDATAYAREEHRRLRGARANVVHTLRLVHRTDAGDRAIWMGEPVRGDKPPLP